MTSSRPIFIDITEFYDNPVRTGIQRTVHELIRNWPSNVPVQFVRYDKDADGLITISSRATRFLADNFGKSSLTPEEVGREARTYDVGAHASPVRLKSTDKILIPELFYCGYRAEFYRQAIRKQSFLPHMLVNDFMPWLKPDLYRVGASMPFLMLYIQLAIEMDHLGFISEATRDDFTRRVARTSKQALAPIPTLGGDGIDLERQSFDSSRRNLVCVGTFHAKKCQDLIFEAFRSLPADPEGGKLQFVGKVPDDLDPRLSAILDYKGEDVEVFDDPSDDELRALLRQARATVFISPNEGYGLPALESLFCGIPVIVYDKLPSVAGMENAGGHVRMKELTRDSLVEALENLRDDGYAQLLWRQAADLNIPTWEDFAVSVASWLQSTVGLANSTIRPVAPKMQEVSNA